MEDEDIKKVTKKKRKNGRGVVETKRIGYEI